MNELEKLRGQAKQGKERLNTRLRELYQYARANGFNAEEARLLSHSSKKKIDRLIVLQGNK